jgi:hypothetical protein
MRLLLLCRIAGVAEPVYRNQNITVDRRPAYSTFGILDLDPPDTEWLEQQSTGTSLGAWSLPTIIPE